MNKVKSLLIITNIFVLFLLLGTTVFAWFTTQSNTGDLDSDVERDVFLSSSMLFDAFYTATLYNTNSNIVARYNTKSSEYQVNGDRSLRFKRSDLYSHINNSNVLRLEITAYVKAFSNIIPRFNVIQKWQSSNGETIENQGLVTFDYGDDIDIISGNEFVYYDSILEKSDQYVPITLVKEFHISNKAMFNNNGYLSISIIFSAMQYNRIDAFYEEASVFKQNVTFNSNYNMNHFVIDRQQLSTFNTTLSNIVMKFKRYHMGGKLTDSVGKYDEYVYINHPRTVKDNFIIPAGNYEMSIYVINQMTPILNQTTNPTKATLTYTYDEDTWGIEDYIYAAKPVLVNLQDFQFKSGELVYYQGSIYKRVQDGKWGFVPSDTPPYALYNLRYRPGTTYFTNDKVFYQGSFWLVTNDWVRSTPEVNTWGWSRYEGSSYSPKITTYNKDSFVWVDNDGSENSTYDNLSWYHGTTKGNIFNRIASDTAWKKIGYEFDSINAGQKYEAGEVVSYNGDWYVVVTSNTWIDNNPSSNNAFLKGVIKGEFNPSATYNRGSIVSVSDNGNTKQYMWYKSTNAPVGIIPGTNGSAGWRDLSQEWNRFDDYRYTNYIRETVTYKGKTYLWNGANNDNSIDPPGEGFNDWIELTIYWTPYNHYKEGDFVIYDGSYWRAKTDNLVDPSTGANMIPRAKGSYEYWEEWKVELFVGRDD